MNTTEIKREHLEQLTREELIDLVLQVIEKMQARIDVLETELAKLKEPPTTSRNSSQPPSKDVKPNLPSNRSKKKHGPPYGHQKYSRPMVENPDRVIQVPVTECESCLADLSGVAPENFERRQIVELPRVSPIVIETRQHHTACPHCHHLNRAPLPEGLEAERFFGPNLEATIVFLKQTQHLSYERIVSTMHDLYGVELSEGAIASILERAGEKAAPVAEEIRKRVIAASVVKSDETSARVKAKNWWHWVFISDEGIYHRIVPTRGAKEIKDVMGSLCVEIWVCDCYGSQLKAPAQIFQLCLAHQIRDLQKIIDGHPKEQWAIEMQSLFREAIHLRNQAENLTEMGFARRVTQIENQLERLLEERVVSVDAQRLQNRYIKHSDKLLTFLHYPEVPPTNNESEQALRGSVVHRKVTNGFRSEWGARTYAALQTIIATAKHKGEDVFLALVNLMGTPVLPFLDGISP
jgi:transposase